ncbi:MAG: diphthine synthase [Thermofilum sp.]|uniref:Diphthine synthase n=1 Tax=Thermofilum pendens TaxID=2269 RepID=A0A7C4H7P7_THEPE
MLVIAGIGLYGLRDLPLGVIEIARGADRIYLEQYTSLAPGFSLEALEELFGKHVEEVARQDLEEQSGRELLEQARKSTVLLLTFGHPLIATTHTSLVVEARKAGIPVKILPAPSVFDGVICSTGLHVYRFGRPVTLVFPERGRKIYPYTTYAVIRDNLRRGLHTLLLLEIRRQEGVYMDVATAAALLLELEEVFHEHVISEDTLAIGVARATAPDEVVKVGELRELAGEDFGPPPHSVVIPGVLHDSEIEFLSSVHGAPVEVMINWNKHVKKRLESTFEP